MGLDRKTVRSALHSEHWRPYSLAQRSSKLDEHMAWLSERAPQVNFSVRILHQELRLHRGFEGSYEVVKVAVRPLRAQAASAALTQSRFETAPGEQAQVDWGQVTPASPLSNANSVHARTMRRQFRTLGKAMRIAHTLYI